MGKKIAGVGVDRLSVLIQPYMVDLGFEPHLVTQADVDQHNQWRKKEHEPDETEQDGVYCTDCDSELPIGSPYWGEQYEPNCAACEGYWRLENLLDAIPQLPWEPENQGFYDSTHDAGEFVAFAIAFGCSGLVDVLRATMPHVMKTPPKEPEPSFRGVMYVTRGLRITEEELERRVTELGDDYRRFFERKEVYHVTEKDWNDHEKHEERHALYLFWKEKVEAEMDREVDHETAAAARFMLDWLKEAGVERHELPLTYELLESRRSFLERLGQVAEEIRSK